jgi:hypothetical protein
MRFMNGERVELGEIDESFEFGEEESCDGVESVVDLDVGPKSARKSITQ